MIDTLSVPLECFPCISLYAYTGRQVDVENYPQPVVVDLLGLEIPKQNIPLLLKHDLSQIVGLTMRLEVRYNALLAVGVVDVGLPAGHDVWSSGLLGFPWQVSIGATPSDIERIADGRHVEINGRPVIGPCFVMRRSNLQEISLVERGADDFTKVNFHPPRPFP